MSMVPTQEDWQYPRTPPRECDEEEDDEGNPEKVKFWDSHIQWDEGYFRWINKSKTSEFHQYLYPENILYSNLLVLAHEVEQLRLKAAKKRQLSVDIFFNVQNAKNLGLEWQVYKPSSDLDGFDAAINDAAPSLHAQILDFKKESAQEQPDTATAVAQSADINITLHDGGVLTFRHGDSKKRKRVHELQEDEQGNMLSVLPSKVA
ncbi:MAG: hypothetical protein M1828_002256 [Chrysothrix sp. TS-e1954]|nr:MAG: hypothetical protein M1828_002256 [Chrysothrix sp. TS-e1954]